MKLTWLGHSCYLVEQDGYRIVIDPYKDGSVPGLKGLALSANEVLCSHMHDDHGYKEAITMVPATAPTPFQITRIESTHDDEGGSRRGGNIIHVLEAKGVRVAHLGDLGCMLSKAQIEEIGRIDALMIPIGGFYTIDAEQAKQVADVLSQKVILPMHYRSKTFGMPVLINTVEDFLSLYADEQVRRADTNEIDIELDMPVQVVALQYL